MYKQGRYASQETSTGHPKALAPAAAGPSLDAALLNALQLANVPLN